MYNTQELARHLPLWSSQLAGGPLLHVHDIDLMLPWTFACYLLTDAFDSGLCLLVSHGKNMQNFLQSPECPETFLVTDHQLD